MLFLASIMLFLGGFIPLLIAKRFLKSHNTIYIIGWIAWFVGIAIKSAIGLFVGLSMPWMIAADSSQLYIYAVIVETAEVVSAYVFIKYHPSMKRLNLHDILAFGVGFGVGEAFTLAWVVFLPLDLPFQGMLSFIAMFERFSAVLVHLASVVFIGLYLKTKRLSDIAAGILSKDLSVAVLVVPLLLTGITAENATFVTELVLAAYAVFWSWLLYMRLRDTKIPKPGERAEIRLKSVAICICVYFLAYLPYMAIAAFLPTEFAVQSVISFITYIMIVTLLFYHIARKRVRRTEAMLGGFIGAGLFQMMQNIAGALFALDIYMQAIQAGASLMASYMYPFIGILLGLWFYEMIIKKRLKLPHT